MQFWKLEYSEFKCNTQPVLTSLVFNKHLVVNSQFVFAPASAAQSRDRLVPLLDSLPLAKLQHDLYRFMLLRSYLELNNKKISYSTCRRFPALFGGFFSHESYETVWPDVHYNGFSFFSVLGKCGWVGHWDDYYSIDAQNMNIIFDKNFPLKNSGEFGFFPCIPMFENLRPLDRFFQMKNFARSYRPRFGVDFLAPENSRSDQVFSRFYLQSKAEFGFIPLHPIPFFSGGGLISFSNKDFDLSLLFNNFGSGKLFLGNYKRKINSAVFPFDQIGVVLKSCAFNEAGLAHFDNFKKRFIKYSFNSFKKTRYAYQFNAATPFNLSRRIVDKFRRRYFFAVRGYLLERSSWIAHFMLNNYRLGSKKKSFLGLGEIFKRNAARWGDLSLDSSIFNTNAWLLESNLTSAYLRRAVGVFGEKFILPAINLPVKAINTRGRRKRWGGWRSNARSRSKARNNPFVAPSRINNLILPKNFTSNPSRDFFHNLTYRSNVERKTRRAFIGNKKKFRRIYISSSFNHFSRRLHSTRKRRFLFNK